MHLAMDTRPAAYAVLIERGNILLAHFNPTGAEHRAGWTLPGGGMEPGEQPAETTLREVAEETGLIIAIDAVLGVHAAYFDPQPTDHHQRPFCAFRTVYRGHTIGGKLTNELNGSTDEARWVPLTELEHITCLPLIDATAQMMGFANRTAWARQARTGAGEY